MTNFVTSTAATIAAICAGAAAYRNGFDFVTSFLVYGAVLFALWSIAAGSHRD